jgi:hypothetical protein
MAPPPFAALALRCLPTRKVAVKELDQADVKLEESFDDLNTIDVYCINPR